jgi:hypothetical protein
MRTERTYLRNRLSTISTALQKNYKSVALKKAVPCMHWPSAGLGPVRDNSTDSMNESP